jgi:hypothetical protein
MNFDAECDSEESLQHWEEALDAMSTSPVDQDERSVDVARFIAAVFNTLELTGAHGEPCLAHRGPQSLVQGQG